MKLLLVLCAVALTSAAPEAADDQHIELQPGVSHAINTISTAHTTITASSSLIYVKCFILLTADLFHW